MPVPPSSLQIARMEATESAADNRGRNLCAAESVRKVAAAGSSSHVFSLLGVNVRRSGRLPLRPLDSYLAAGALRGVETE